ncbi:MAG: MYXO-CTERM sorting domain-containing protein [Nannocystaceae bacterium]
MLWDAATGAPAYVIPKGRRLAGVTADPARARALAQELLSAHADLLAPGCAASDFELVTNRRDGEMRTLGFIQRSRGRAVVGGQLSFRFAHDHLTAIASQAIPCAALPDASPTIASAEASARAAAFVAARDGAAQVSVIEVGDAVVLPRIGDHRVMGADLALPVIVATAAPIGRWRVYVDARTGAPIARESLLFFDAEVRYNVPVRGPLGPRYDAPAPRVSLNSGGDVLLTDADGIVAIAGPTALQATVTGPIVRVLNEWGDEATSDWVLSPGETLLWDQRFDEFVDAQLSTKIHAELVKDRVRAIDPDNPFLDEQLIATVNIADVCNAYSDGNSINFFAAGAGCENTGRISDVVYHEFGHSIHYQSLIPGVGAFNGSLSEGISDYLGATITGDSGLARGFFLDDEPLRELDPDGYEWHWPEDQGEVHYEGQIIGGALWDLRKILRGKHGAAAGTAHADYLWYESIRRAVDIPSMYMESLLADDDDGDLDNGTPNDCEIAAAYGAHGLRTVTASVSDVLVQGPTPSGWPVMVSTGGLLKDCPGGAPSSATLRWQLRGDPNSGAIVAMAPDGDGGFIGWIPNQQDGVVVQYQVELGGAGNSGQLLPSNAADPWYEFYVGEVTPLYCTDFESDPFAEGWGVSGLSSDFEWAPLAGLSGLDPDAPFSGLFAIGNDLAGDGGYDPFTDALLASPQIDTQGFSEVRLQYRRWLSVEDGFFDQARIYAGGLTMWENYASSWDAEADTHHVDGEWRFHDVDLSAAVLDGTVSLAFALNSDGGLEMGGWTIDDLCVVGVQTAAPAGVCGDGALDPGEGCDDGNVADGDGCSASCTPETATPDTDTDADTDTDSSATAGFDVDLIDRGCVCAADPRGSGRSGAWLALLLLGLGLRRRRR